ncbi:MAG: hypothetical protein WCW44_05750 [archaeon]|jgi:hypothetical protein
MFSKELFLRIKYPKLWVLLILIAISFLPFLNKDLLQWATGLGNTAYIFVFIAGALFPFGILAPFSASFMVNTYVPDIFAAALLAGIGAVIVDLSIFRLIRRLFKNDFIHVKDKQLIQLNGFFSKNWFGRKLVNYASFALAGWIVAAPLPNDTGKKLVAIISKLSEPELVALSFCANTLAFLFFLWL